MKFSWGCPAAERAATRVELVFALVGLALLTLIAVPLLAGNNPASEMAVCKNNLRQIGLGFRTWANDHDDQYPWWVHESRGGTYRSPKSGNAWLEFLTLSNHLASPKFIVCPSDASKHFAQRWLGSPGGLVASTNRDSSVSYFIGLHAVRDNPQSLLSGDRHMVGLARSFQGCSTGIQNATPLTPSDPTPAWTNELHGLRANLLFHSGEVRTVSKEELSQSLDARTEENFVHVLTSY